ncbi:hypothetical protein G7K71_14050 [Desulfofundulus sp. TPOSR]|uniref:hypothetical protein n=1 Tax=Desulfofundulus sp. TPOSR TaxID=2714340 RepID=UPI0014082405|nr:hypothetical protein [Desulfofundulus sp. TPOSR]NHM28081.1 hypothetical protein [Desulfofundulus sp. TPOSR]
MMFQEMKALLANESGSSFLENMLWIALFTLAVGAGVATLTGATKAKLGEIVNKINGVGTP